MKTFKLLSKQGIRLQEPFNDHIHLVHVNFRIFMSFKCLDELIVDLRSGFNLKESIIGRTYSHFVDELDSLIHVQ